MTSYHSNYGWLVMALLWAIEIPAGMMFFSLGVLLPVWQDTLGVTPLQAGLLGAAGFLGFGMTALPAGIWLTKYNPKLVILTSVVGMAAMAFVQSIAHTTTILLVSRIALVMFIAIRLQVQVIFVQQWFTSRIYSTVNGFDFGSRSLAHLLGLAATPPLIVLLGGWRSFMTMLSITLLSLSLVWAILGRERSVATQNNMTPPTKNQNPNPASVLKRHKVLWLVAGCNAGNAVVFASFISFFPTYAIDHLGISLTAIGMMMGVFPVGGLIGTLVAGPMSQAIGRRKPIIWMAGILLPLIYTALLHVDYSPTMLLLFLIAGAVSTAVFPVLFTIPFDMKLSPREVSVAFGLMRTLFPVGAMFGPLLIGAIQHVTGSLSLGLSITAPMALSLFVGGILLPETCPPQKGQSITNH